MNSYHPVILHIFNGIRVWALTGHVEGLKSSWLFWNYANVDLVVRLRLKSCGVINRHIYLDVLVVLKQDLV